MRSFNLFVSLSILQLKIKLEYPSDFILQLLAVTIRQGVWLAFISVLFTNLPHIKGWGYWDIIFLYGLATIPLGLNELFLDGSWELPYLIRNGEFDKVLIRPFNPIFQVFSHANNIHGLGNVAVGMVAMVWAAPHLHTNWAAWKILFLVMTMISGTVIYASITLSTASLAFWIGDLGFSAPLLVNQVADYARFPLSLYPPIVSGLLTWVLPFAFVGFLPMTFILGYQKTWVALGVPAAACTSLLTAYLVFNCGLNRYESTGH